MSNTSGVVLIVAPPPLDAALLEVNAAKELLLYVGRPWPLQTEEEWELSANEALCLLLLGQGGEAGASRQLPGISGNCKNKKTTSGRQCGTMHEEKKRSSGLGGRISLARKPRASTKLPSLFPLDDDAIGSFVVPLPASHFTIIQLQASRRKKA